MGSPLVPVVRALCDRVVSRPDGLAALKEYDQLIQFTVLDGDPFYLEVKGVVRKPHINHRALKAMVGIVADEFPEQQTVDLDRFVDDGTLVQLDRSGFIDRLGR